MSALRRVILSALLVLSSLFFAVPVLWMLVLAIRPSSVSSADPLAFIFVPDFSAFAYV